MKKILVFVNFIESSQLAIDQAIAFGKMHGSDITVCHITDGKNDSDELKQKLKPYTDRIEKARLNSELILEKGAFFNLAVEVANRLSPDLVIMGTRGVEGFDMSLRGSAIYKLVSELPHSSLVLPTKSAVATQGFKMIMLPVSPHPKFLKKVSETRKVLASDGEIVVLTILRKDAELDQESKKNLSDAVEYLKENKVNHKLMEFERDNKGHGYAAITLRKIKEEGMDLISIISNVSDRNKHFGKMEKEDVLLNEEGIPVFCVNTAVD